MSFPQYTPQNLNTLLGTPPGSGITVLQGDTLRLAVSSSASPAVTVSATANLLLPDGTRTDVFVTQDSTTDRTYNVGFTKTPLPTCVLESATIYTKSPPAQPSTLRADLSLFRSGRIIAYLCGGSLSGTLLLPTYPPAGGSPGGPIFEPRGRIYTVTGAAPGAGAETSDAVPANAIWRLISYSTTLVTSGVANNRTTSLIIDNGTSTQRIVVLQDTTTQAASLTRTHLFQTGTSAATATSFTQTDTQTVLVRDSIPGNLFLFAGDKLRTVTGLIDTGDQYGTPFIRVEEWLA